MFGGSKSGFCRMSTWDQTLARQGIKRTFPFKARGAYRKTCAVCEAEIPARQRKFCSIKCRRKSQYRPHTQRLLKIDQKTYNDLLNLHNHACAICKSSARLVIDHCHDTLAFRGLLCNECNVGLGLFRDDPVRMRKAIAYLENNPWKL